MEDRTLAMEERIPTLVAEWQERLGLADWDIQSGAGELVTPHADAQILPNAAYRIAILLLHPDTSEELEESLVVHELSHLLTLELATYAEQLIEDFAPKLAHEHLGGVLEERVETVTDRIARVVLALAGRPHVVDWQRFAS